MWSSSRPTSHTVRIVGWDQFASSGQVTMWKRRPVTDTPAAHIGASTGGAGASSAVSSNDTRPPPNDRTQPTGTWRFLPQVVSPGRTRTANRDDVSITVPSLGSTSSRNQAPRPGLVGPVDRHGCDPLTHQPWFRLVAGMTGLVVKSSIAMSSSSSIASEIASTCTSTG